MEQKALQLGSGLLALALLLRVAVSWKTGQQELGRTLLFFSTGRMVSDTAQLPDPGEAALPENANAELPELAEPAAVPVFGQSQEALVQVNASWQVDTLALLQEPLNWDLRAAEPTVLILHSHATESYEKEPGCKESSPYRTLDTDYNMVSIGSRVAEVLEAGGIRVIHDRELHDYPSYNNAYINSRDATEVWLEKYPGILMVLDLHRDAAEDGSGRQKVSTVNVGGNSSAQLMLVMGSNKGNRSFPNWERNLALAVKLQAQLEQQYPGLCRPIRLVTARYNQDLSNGALLVEVGTAGNTHQQALTAAEYLAQGILALANGANY